MIDTVKNYIDSGVLEMYVLGLATKEENKEVVRMAGLHPGIQHEIEMINALFFNYIHQHSISPHPSVRLAVIDCIRQSA